MAKIALDVVGGTDIAAYATQFGLTHTVLEENGPGGGNPLVQFEGTADQLVAMIADYDGTNGEAEWLAEQIVE